VVGWIEGVAWVWVAWWEGSDREFGLVGGTNGQVGFASRWDWLD
jgi:hypothetical protein